MNHLTRALVLLCAAFGALSCHSPSLTKVDVRAENQPPIPAQVSSSGITLTEGVGVAIQFTPYVDDKTSSDTLNIQNTSTAVMTPGSYGNEYFFVGGPPGTGKL